MDAGMSCKGLPLPPFTYALQVQGNDVLEIVHYVYVPLVLSVYFVSLARS